MRSVRTLTDDELADALKELAAELWSHGNTACAVFVREAIRRFLAKT